MVQNNRLNLNDSKTEFIFLSSKFLNNPSFHKITIGDSEMDFDNATKNLGVTFYKQI